MPPDRQRQAMISHLRNALIWKNLVAQVESGVKCIKLERISIVAQSTPQCFLLFEILIICHYGIRSAYMKMRIIDKKRQFL